MSIKKITSYLSITIFMLIIAVTSAMAQPGGSGSDPLPCDPDDTSPACAETPLDTWIYVIVIVALIYGYYHLKKQKESLLTQ